MHSPTALHEFPPALVAATEAALDAGLFYDTDVHRFVLERLGGAGATPTPLRTVELPLRDHAGEQAISEELKRSPRGTYAVLRYVRCDGSSITRAPMADGRGDLSAHGASDPFDPDDPGAPAHVLDRMIGYEISCCRRAIEAARERARNLAAMATHGFASLQRIRQPLRIGRHTYSSAIVTGVQPEQGTLSLELTRRGSARRAQTTLGAADLVRALQHGHSPTTP